MVNLTSRRCGNVGPIDLSNSEGTVHLVVLSGASKRFQSVSGTGGQAAASGSGRVVLRPGALGLISDRR